MFDLNYLWWIVPLSFVASLFLWLALDGVRFYFFRKIADSSFRRFSSSAPLIIIATGPQGSGKTTLNSGLINYATLKLMGMAQDKVSEIKSIFYDLDFNPINNLIAGMQSRDIYDFDLFLKKLYRGIPYMKGYLKGDYDNYLSVSSRVSLMSDYFYAFYALQKNNYVYCNQSRFYSHITRNYAQRCSPSIMEAKYSYETGSRMMDLYSIFNDDEKVLSAKNTDSAKIAAEDRGFDLTLRLIRHLSKETWFYFASSQNFGRIVKEQRELCLGEFAVGKRKELCVMRLGIFFLTIFSDFIKWLQSLYLSLFDREHSDRFYFSSLPFGKTLYKVTDLINRCSASGYVLYKGTIFTEYDDSGNHVSDGSIPFSYLIPDTFCYGSAERYGFGFLGDELRARAVGRSIPDSSLASQAETILTPKSSAEGSSPKASGVKSGVVELNDTEGLF